MRDFTISKYIELLDLLVEKGYSFQTLDEYLRSPEERAVVLRHDVDQLPENSLAFAKLQNQKKVKGVYYFRAVPESWDEKVIKGISALGHEIGYHYECLTTTNGNLEKGITDFEKNLNALRKLAPVLTICMHGSPTSKYDSKDLWKKYDYKRYDITGEPYFDVDFKKMLYLTDTGRCWNGDEFNVRDKVNSGFNLSFHSTDDIIGALKRNELPSKIMFTFHPQRWNNNKLKWLKELITQNLKNQLKKMFYVKR